MRKLKFLELFAGISAPRKAITNLGIDAEFTPIEFSKKVLDVYNALYDEEHELKDVTKFRGKRGEFDVIVAGFPCQPFSFAGNQLGFNDKRGKLFKDTLRIIDEVEPDLVILENVKGILQPKNKWIVTEIVKTLQEMYYAVSVNLYNAKYWIPQNRERVFIIATKLPVNYGFDDLQNRPKRTTILKDYLDKNVEFTSQYHFDNKKLQKLIDYKPLSSSEPFTVDELKEISKPIYGSDKRRWGIIRGDNKTINIPLANYNVSNFFSTEDGNALTVTSSVPGQIMIEDSTGYISIEDRLYLLRKMTENEAWRLMGFSDDDFNKVKHLPNSHLYFTAGNSMVVPVLESIFRARYG